MVTIGPPDAGTTTATDAQCSTTAIVTTACNPVLVVDAQCSATTIVVLASGFVVNQ
jgi:hypothetical protein